jgi:hypothetical protein
MTASDFMWRRGFAGLWTSIHDHELASRAKAPEHMIEHYSRITEFMIRICDENGIYGL